jgi:presenilin-like A22 family membrane protease
MLKNQYVNGMVVTGDTENPLNALLFIGYILAGAVFIMILIRYFRMQKLLFMGMEFFLIATSGSIVFYAFLRLVAGYEPSTLGAIALGLMLAATKFFRNEFKNMAAIMATAGAGVVFGVSLGILPVVLFLVLLSVYDYLSVFLTKHMVEIANHVIKNDLAFTITATEAVPGQRQERRIDLGTGDIIAPVMFEVSTLSYSPVATLFVFAGATVAITAFLVLVWKKKMVLPALPPIVFGMVIFFLIGLLLGVY